jgi:hypothetical protein
VKSILLIYKSIAYDVDVVATRPPSNSVLRRPRTSPVDIHVFAAETFDLGREEIDAGHGLALGLYSAERCLVDLIRLRHREGADVA